MANRKKINKMIFIVLLTIFGLQSLFSQNDLKAKYDVKQYILDLNISNTSTEISGNVITNAVVVTSELDTFAIDLVNNYEATQTYMIVDSVFVNGVVNEFIHENDIVLVPLQQTILQEELFSVQIFYHGQGGCGFNTLTYMDIAHVYTISQPDHSKYWWPCKQDLYDKADSLIFYITTDAENISGSQGVLESTEYLPEGKARYKWVSKYPIAYYLISFVVGAFSEHITYAQLPNQQDSLLIQSLLFSNSSYYPTHLVAINKTKELLYLFSELIGSYPFKDEKYGNCVIGGPLGAMENQTMSTFGYRSMDTTSNDYFGYYYWYVAHELAHQWFGDYVTCKRWNDIFLNEGFASYFEYIALQNLESQARANYWMTNAHTSIKTVPGGSVYSSDSITSWDDFDIFSYRLMYKKGGAIPHILRYEVNNDSLFFSILRNYLTKFAYSTATIEDFKEVVELTTESNFTDFFNQWIYGEGYPIFNLKWHQQEDTLFVESVQTTSTSITPLFKTHFDLRLIFTTGNDTIVRLYQETNNEIFRICVSNPVRVIRFDPNIWLISKNSISNVGIDEYLKDNSLLFNAYPNPAHDKITIVVEEENLQNLVATIYDMQGKVIVQKKIKDNNTEINVSVLPKGVFILELKNKNKIGKKSIILQ